MRHGCHPHMWQVGLSLFLNPRFLFCQVDCSDSSARPDVVRRMTAGHGRRSRPAGTAPPGPCGSRSALAVRTPAPCGSAATSRHRAAHARGGMRDRHGGHQVTRSHNSPRGPMDHPRPRRPSCGAHPASARSRGSSTRWRSAIAEDLGRMPSCRDERRRSAGPRCGDPERRVRSTAAGDAAAKAGGRRATSTSTTASTRCGKRIRQRVSRPSAHDPRGEPRA